MRVPLPSSITQRIRPLPQWPPVALRAPQAAVQIRLVASRAEFDVTRTAVVASLRPLTLAVGIDAALAAAISSCANPGLQFVDLDSRRAVGMLELTHTRNWRTSGAELALFEVQRGSHQCVRWPYRSWNRWLQNRRMRKNKDPNNFLMPPEAIQQQMIFYICPRPVVLISVDESSHSNLFPMDLIGPVSADRFTLALRSTSPSIDTMKSARRVAISDVPAQQYATAYELGIHHKNPMVQWEQLPFGIMRSQRHSLRYPAMALRVREAQILDFDTIGSHTLFVCRIETDILSGDEAQFFHTSGIYQHFRSRNGRAFSSAAQGQA